MNQKSYLNESINFIYLSDYFLKGDEVVHDEFISGGQRIFVRLNVQSVKSFMLLHPPKNIEKC